MPDLEFAMKDFVSESDLRVGVSLNGCGMRRRTGEIL